MNQILQVQEPKNNSKPIDTKKVVLFFAVSIIIFGLIMLGQGAYNIYLAKANEKVDSENPPSVNENEGENMEVAPPTIILTQAEDNKLIINIESEVAISHIIYNWNNEASKTFDETGKTNIEEIIDIPAGENTFNLSVIDEKGREHKEQKLFIVEVSKPIIDLSIVGNEIKINVTSKVELSNVVYSWNLEPENKEDMLTYENRTKFEKLVEIPKGQNTLKIVATDINGNKTEKSQEIKGVVKAKTDVVVKGKYLYFTVTGDDNIKKVEFEFNGKKHTMNEKTYGQTNTVQYRVEMREGTNYLKVISTTQSDAVDTTVWKYEYKDQ